RSRERHPARNLERGVRRPARLGPGGAAAQRPQQARAPARAPVPRRIRLEPGGTSLRVVEANAVGLARPQCLAAYGAARAGVRARFRGPTAALRPPDVRLDSFHRSFAHPGAWPLLACGTKI